MFDEHGLGLEGIDSAMQDSVDTQQLRDGDMEEDVGLVDEKTEVLGDKMEEKGPDGNRGRS